MSQQWDASQGTSGSMLYKFNTTEISGVDMEQPRNIVMHGYVHNINILKLVGNLHGWMIGSFLVMASVCMVRVSILKINSVPTLNW